MFDRLGPPGSQQWIVSACWNTWVHVSHHLITCEHHQTDFLQTPARRIISRRLHAASTQTTWLLIHRTSWPTATFRQDVTRRSVANSSRSCTFPCWTRRSIRSVRRRVSALERAPTTPRPRWPIWTTLATSRCLSISATGRFPPPYLSRIVRCPTVTTPTCPGEAYISTVVFKTLLNKEK